MNAFDAYRQMKSKLLASFSERESEQMARIYFEDVFGLRIGLRETDLDADQVAKLTQDADRLVNHEPLAYITGKTFFYGNEFIINHQVLIPRPETEELVHWIIEDLNGNDFAESKICDIGCGSGCIAVSLAKVLGKARITAVDISKAALELTARNSELNSVQLQLVEDNILSEDSAIHFDNYDIIVSNPPYISKREVESMSTSTLMHEPKEALFADKDGLQFYQCFADRLTETRMRPKRLYLEVNEFSAEQIESIYTSIHGRTELRKDLQGKWRMLRVVLD